MLELDPAASYLRWQTAPGVRDVLPEEATVRRQLEAIIRETLAAAGYQEVETPIFEYEEVIRAGGWLQDETGECGGVVLTGAGSPEVYRFFDREGHTLVLRPDMTTPIARLAATRLASAPRPLRLAYIADVFRYEEVHAGRLRQFRQAGVERIGGAREIDADMEILSLASRLLARLGLFRFRIDIGHAELVRGLIAAGRFGGREARLIRQALRRRDYVLLRELVEQRGEQVGPQDRQVSAARRLLLELPRWRGGFAMLEAARKQLAFLLGDFPQLAAALDDLHALLTRAKEEGLGIYERESSGGGPTQVIALDLGLVRDLGYYTGPVLEGFVPEVGFTLLTGGRYDRLLEQFGSRPEPATGFAIGLERVILARERAGRLR
ncbi:MAG: ATP phosphoribosyltransferase regulatory subunit [Limnochordales bacterium]|nr:ATP phosphoribosyltransferase regulatory subunit [Limnochordales bacterium]